MLICGVTNSIRLVQGSGLSSEKTLTKAFGNPVITRRKVGRNSHDSGRVVCRSLELTTALGMVENHNRLLPSTESRSGPVNNAMRYRGVLVPTCVLVALDSPLLAPADNQRGSSTEE